MDGLERRLMALGRQTADWTDTAALQSSQDVVTEARARFLDSLTTKRHQRRSVASREPRWAPKRQSLPSRALRILEWLLSGGFAPGEGRREHAARPRLVWLAVTTGVACLVGVAVLLGIRPQAPPSLTFMVRSNDHGRVGEWLLAKDGPLELRFSEGTRVSVAPSTRLSVEHTTPDGATLKLAHGHAIATVQHRPGAHWEVKAGPFTVRVTGTVFEVTWNPDTQLFEVALHRGAVVVAGPTLGRERSLRSGESLRIELGVPQPEPTSLPVPRQGRPLPATSAIVATPGANLDGSMPAPPAAAQPGREAAVWRGALREGRRQDALEAIERAGASAVLSVATPNELYAISDAARIERRPRLATQALLALRSRHGVRGQTAYLLGKIAADQLRSRSEAAEWFGTYLRESPSGTLAEQALGRLVELQAGTANGRAAAAHYLERYPGGAYAALARREAGAPGR